MSSPAVPRWSRILRAVGRGVVRCCTADNGLLWLHGIGYPYLGPHAFHRYSGRGDDQHP